MEEHFVYFVILVTVTAVPSFIDAQCVLPIQGSWTMSRTDVTMEFVEGTITGWIFPTFTTYVSDFRCIDNDASKFVMRGDAIFPTNRHVFVCLHFFEITQDRAVFSQATITGPGSRPTYGTVITDDTANTGGNTLGNICNLGDPIPAHRYHVFVRSGTQPSTPCPSILLGLFDLSPACAANVDVCTNSSLVQVSGATCTPSPFYYGRNPVKCLLGVNDGTNTFVTFMNDDTFVCAVLSLSGNVVRMSQRHLECLPSQTPTSGGDLFTLQKSECPTTTTALSTTSTTGTPPPDEGLSAQQRNIIIGLVFAVVIILILIIIIIIIICRKRKETKRKEEERKRLERRERRHEERRRRRQEREERRKQGFPVSDTESDDYSTDSGYIRQSTSTLHEEGGVLIERKKKKKSKSKKSRKLSKKVRKIFDEKGNLLKEEEIPLDTEDSGDETVYTVTKDGRKMKKRRVKKTRRYEREITLPNGKTIKELVESDYWETCSEHSVSSSEEDDPVLNEMKLAMKKRKKERNDMMHRIEDRQKDNDQKEEPQDHSADATDSTEHRTVKSDDDRENRLAELSEGPVVFRPAYDKRVARQERRKKPGFLRRLFKRNHKKPTQVEDGREEDGREEDGEERDRYMKEYKEKKRLEGKLDDEGFWEDGATKKTAKDIFDMDRLEGILDGRQSQEHGDPSVYSGYHSDTQLDTSGKEETDDQTKEGSVSGDNLDVNLKRKEEPAVKFKKEENEEAPSEKHVDKKAKKQVSKRISKLLTERLFSSEPSDDRKSSMKQVESKKQGRVIFVEEVQDRQIASTKLEKAGALPPLKKTPGQRSLPVFKGGPVVADPEKAAMYREGLLKDQHIIDNIEAEENENFQYENDSSSPDIADIGNGISPLNRARLKSSVDPNKSFRGQIKEAWGTRDSHSRNPRAERDDKKNSYAVSTPKFHSYLNFLRGWGHGNQPGNLTDRDTGYTREGGKSKRLLMDDARLRRLLEELYKDKKFMDYIILAEESRNEEMVKDLAVHGRDYLIAMAHYWEEKGPLPPRPSVTALGFKLERSKSMYKEREPDLNRPPLERNKTVC